MNFCESLKVGSHQKNIFFWWKNKSVLELLNLARKIDKKFFFFLPYIHPSEYWLATLAWYKGNFCVTFLGTPPPDRPLWTNLMFFHHFFPPTFCADHFSPSERNWKKIENILFSIIESWSERCCWAAYLVWSCCQWESFSYYFCTSENPSLGLHPVKIEFLRIFKSRVTLKKYIFLVKKTKVS